MPDGSVLGKKGAYADVNGARLYYEIHGSGEPLLLMHGGFEAIESLYHQAETLSRYFRVILPERRGHGRTGDTEGPIGYLQGARDMAALMEHLKIKNAHLAGYSDGAIVALFMGIHYPERVRKIVSISCNYHWAGLSARFLSKMRALTPERFEQKEVRTMGIYRRVSPDGPAHFPVIFGKIKHLWLTQPRLTSRDLARITAPVLVMAADGDLISPVHTVNLYRSLPKAQLCIVPGTTHALITEAPEEVNGAITKFLR